MDVLTSVDPTSSQPSSADPFHPSFFELAAQSQLQDLIKPAIRYVLAVLAQRNPRYLLRLVNRFDEVYALLMAGIETHYLRVWGSSFAENFYGLRRRRRPGLSRSQGGTSVSQAKSERLGKTEVRLSLLFLVGLPYVGAKLEDLWERNGGGLSNASLFGEETATFNDTSLPLRERAKKVATETFKTAYPYAKTVYQLWLLTYNVRYLFDRTPYWRPWFAVMRVDVRRVGPNDGPRKQLLPKKMPSLVRQPARFLSMVLRLAPGTIFEALKYGLPASIFFFKFLEWWYGADNPRRRRTGGSGTSGGGAGDDTSHPTLDPPIPLLPDLTHGLLSKSIPTTIADTLPEYKLPHIFTLSSTLLDKLANGEEHKPTLTTSGGKRRLVHNSCPLCGALPINNPAVLPSGYVFCYTCAFNYVEEHARCPVTSLAVPERKDALRKVLG
ncbi:Pex, N-terminal [Kalmanozyma brasiliensis GHG001]|uniref:Peroxisome assembly protein 12 n=1 Tax=Kalmanozyma brasiliensis (strain GHG001) TaxID=1365824 RepID=V5EH63_KALBG|nr:Pex, N-terminal [Kalmanozyma brasiliensis GHG001]EST09916.1 Pex, N-terminal [Kalmanozyma brasiliensis GHG001]